MNINSNYFPLLISNTIYINYHVSYLIINDKKTKLNKIELITTFTTTHLEDKALEGENELPLTEQNSKITISPSIQQH